MKYKTEDFSILKTILQKRKSIYPKDYLPTSIDLNILKEIVEFSKLAPQHKKTSPWIFHIYTGTEKKELSEKMISAYKMENQLESMNQKKIDSIKEKCEQAAAIITIGINISGKIPEWEEIAATSMAVQNMYLLCTAQNLGCYWSTPKWSEKLKKEIQLEENQKLLGFFYVGNIPE